LQVTSPCHCALIVVDKFFWDTVYITESLFVLEYRKRNIYPAPADVGYSTYVVCIKTTQVKVRVKVTRSRKHREMRLQKPFLRFVVGAAVSSHHYAELRAAIGAIKHGSELDLAAADEPVIAR